MREYRENGIQQLKDLGVQIKSIMEHRDDMELTHLIVINDDIRISVHYHRDGYSFYLHRPIFDRANIDWRTKERILTEAGLVTPQRMHKPCLKRTKNITAYWTKAYEILKKYYDERMETRASEILEIVKLGGVIVNPHGHNENAFGYVARSKYFTLHYDFKDFTHTSKSLRYESHEAYKREAEMFGKFKSGGF